MDIFGQVAERIIKAQEAIIGSVALEQAKKVQGLTFNDQKHEVALEGNKTAILEKLVEKYQDIFGKASVEVCRTAVKSMIGQMPKDQVPSLLQ